MTDAKPERQGRQILRETGLAFFGTITASLSHELNNALAIINEHGGLLHDLLQGAEQGTPIDERKLQRISRKIAAQVERGHTLTKRLNRFAHSTDADRREIDLDELLRELVDLSQRLAGLRMVQLELRPAGQPLRLMGNPFLLQQAVFLVFQLFWEEAEQNRLIRVSAEACDRGVRVVISANRMAAPEVTREQRAFLQVLMEELQGEVEVRSGESEQTVVLSLFR